MPNMQCVYTGTMLLFTLCDLDLDDVVRVALWLKFSLPGGKKLPVQCCLHTLLS